MPDSQIQSTLQGGTLQWLAPELLEFDENNPSGGLGSLSSDIYAFGVVCHEVSFSTFCGIKYLTVW